MYGILCINFLMMKWIEKIECNLNTWCMWWGAVCGEGVKKIKEKSMHLQTYPPQSGVWHDDRCPARSPPPSSRAWSRARPRAGCVGWTGSNPPACPAACHRPGSDLWDMKWEIRQVLVLFSCYQMRIGFRGLSNCTGIAHNLSAADINHSIRWAN